MEALTTMDLSIVAGDEEAAIGDSILGGLTGVGVGAAVVALGVATGGAAWVILGVGAAIGAAGGYLAGDGTL
ncbi:hypothetical protein [Sulfoacidibacillus thermotolerans]|uniref:Bacteriocin n=1 Tax=Sulfoacidibacillus thermotolerans TaxID=1765684 RepID=A0A2U3D624_SULT2|nr:hypothetical protein [Sulfoacidibacillus thermotolerans]PWI56732.1 hypothetical protein BM613_12210 [Sulfoacidibacillus thermotolerans]